MKQDKKKPPKAPAKENTDGMNIGPGQYDANIDLTRKKPPTCNWSSYRTKRQPQVPKTQQEGPGPDKYNQQQASIGMKMMRGIIQQENVLDDKNKGV